MFRKIVIFPIRLYQWIVRPLFPSVCVFHAHGKLSCSEYAIVTITTQGVLRGIFLGGYRILRCHPWQKNFNDPEMKM